MNPGFSGVIVTLAVILCACSKDTRKPAETTAAPPSVPAPVKTFTSETVRLSVSPNKGTGEDQIFSVRVDKGPGAVEPVVVGLLINREVTGNSACYAFYDIAGKQGLLANDSGVGSKPIGPGGKISNGQCSLLSEGTALKNDDPGLTADLHVRFNKTFSGQKKLSLMAQDASGNVIGPLPGGEWVIPQP